MDDDNVAAPPHNEQAASSRAPNGATWIRESIEKDERRRRGDVESIRRLQKYDRRWKGLLPVPAIPDNTEDVTTEWLARNTLADIVEKAFGDAKRNDTTPDLQAEGIVELLNVVGLAIHAAKDGDTWNALYYGMRVGAFVHGHKPRVDGGRGGREGGRQRHGPAPEQLAAEVNELLEHSHGVSRDAAIQRVGARHNLKRTAMYDRLNEAAGKTVG